MRAHAMEPCYLTAADAAARIRAKTLTCEELVRSCLKRIEERDANVRAFIRGPKASTSIATSAQQAAMYANTLR